MLLANAPMNNAKTAPDTSRADFLYCKMALERNHPLDDVVAKLAELSEKAKRPGTANYFCERTVAAAMTAIGAYRSRPG
jgi:hypothetical protein